MDSQVTNSLNIIKGKKNEIEEIWFNKRNNILFFIQLLIFIIEKKQKKKKHSIFLNCKTIHIQDNRTPMWLAIYQVFFLNQVLF